MSEPSSPVCAHNEWDPLEEVIVGRLEGACMLPWEPGVAAMMPAEHLGQLEKLHRARAGKPFERWQSEPAQKDLDELVRILEGEGVKVRRPSATDHARPFSTPRWSSPGGFSQANPRHLLVVIGDELIEASSFLRCRYFEWAPYRELIQDYFRRGARWTMAPRPQLGDELFDEQYPRGQGYVTTEAEPVFDAGDIMRCGRDIFVRRSHATNWFGIDWLERHLGERYRVHRLEFPADEAIHLDTTFRPLAPGKVLVNPDRPAKVVPEVFRRAGWDLLVPPPAGAQALDKWMHLDVLMLDERRVLVEKSAEAFIRALKDWGFEPIPCPFRSRFRYGGSFYCATLDVRRRGELKSYF